MPDFLRLNNPVVLDFLVEKRHVDSRMKVWRVASPDKDKLETLLLLLKNISSTRTMIFVNYRESVERVADFLHRNGVPVGIYHGGLEQIDREKAVALFNNGTCRVLVTTDLASRGLDIADVGNIIHYHLPGKAEVYTHRNGRTARVDATGEIYVITGPEETLPDFIRIDEDMRLDKRISALPTVPAMASLYFSAGKKEKISRGDIVGFLLKNTDLVADEVGSIDLHDHYDIVAIPAAKADAVLRVVSALKIKNK